MNKPTGKVAVITGGSSGIGLATAKRFVEEGAHVFITGRHQIELDEAVRQLGTNATAVQSDISKLGDLDRLFAAVKEQRDRIDVLFANAGQSSKHKSSTPRRSAARGRPMRSPRRYYFLGRRTAARQRH